MTEIQSGLVLCEGDKVLITLREPLSATDGIEMLDRLSEAFPGVRFVVLDGADVIVQRAEQPERVG